MLLMQTGRCTLLFETVHEVLCTFGPLSIPISPISTSPIPSLLNTSLNGLAVKIMRGYYPPIHPTYSRHLRELIKSMLHKNPSSRPTVREILRKGIVKKHIHLFFKDIASRPSSNVGGGTMVVRGALSALKGGADGRGMGGAQMLGAGIGDIEVKELLAMKNQLEKLGLAKLVERALAGTDGDATSTGTPRRNSSVDATGSVVGRRQRCPAPSAKELALRQKEKALKDKERALQREKERKKAVELALEKLRRERESRARQRANIRQRRFGGGKRGQRASVTKRRPVGANANLVHNRKKIYGAVPASRKQEAHASAQAAARRRYVNVARDFFSLLLIESNLDTGLRQLQHVHESRLQLRRQRTRTARNSRFLGTEERMERWAGRLGTRRELEEVLTFSPAALPQRSHLAKRTTSAGNRGRLPRTCTSVGR